MLSNDNYWIPSGPKNIILEYCHYPKPYLAELTKYISFISKEFDELSEEGYTDIGVTGFSIHDIKRKPCFIGDNYTQYENKNKIIMVLLDRENTRRVTLGLSRNNFIYCHQNRMNLNY